MISKPRLTPEQAAFAALIVAFCFAGAAVIYLVTCFAAELCAHNYCS